MKIKISNQNIKTLSAGWYDDADVKYLQMHIGKTNAAWYYGRSFQGKFYRVTLGRYPETSRAEAIAQVEHLSENLRRFGNLEGIGTVQHGREYTLEDAWRLYSSRRTIDKHTQQRFDRYFKQWSARPLSSITHNEVALLHAEISQHAPVSANRVVMLLSAIVNQAIRDGAWSGVNPAAMIRKNREVPRRRYLDQTELGRVLSILEQKRQAIRSRVGAEALMMMLLTGARKSNVLAMEWSEVDLSGGMWTIPDTKAKAGRMIRVPLGRQAVGMLSAIRQRSVSLKSRWVFADRLNPERHVADVKTLFHNILREAGVSDCHIHDLRHTNATYQLKAGVDIATVSEILGHADISITKKVYAHVMDDTKKAAADALEATIFAVGQKPD